MISDDTGGNLNVSGITIAIVATAPMPGSTPIKVPTKTPVRQNRRFAGVTAVHQLSRVDARRIAVRAQWLDSERPTDLMTVLRHLTMLQLELSVRSRPAPIW